MVSVYEVNPASAMRSSSASSSEHWISTPSRAATAPTAQAMAFVRPLRATRTVVSISSKPYRAAVAASAAICTGSSLAFVTCAWLLGCRRLRSLLLANASSIVLRCPTTWASLAGVMPAESFTSSARGRSTSTSIRANSRLSSAMAASATLRSK